jgi:hypothetical protein
MFCTLITPLTLSLSLQGRGGFIRGVNSKFPPPRMGGRCEKIGHMVETERTGGLEKL